MPDMRKLVRGAALAAITAGLLAAPAFLLGCVHRSGGEWMVRSASMPEGWPEITPVGEVRVREYPVYRAASVSGADLEGEGMRPMFMELFGHIKDNEIAMTAPVEMTYAGAGGEREMATMAFLYRSTALGAAGEQGAVRVEDLPAMTYASVGVRGAYTAKNYERGLAILDEWLASSDEWVATGPPRYLGYNGPFVPRFARYGEVQAPVTRSAGAANP